jgi:hypothetical protein
LKIQPKPEWMPFLLENILPEKLAFAFKLKAT